MAKLDNHHRRVIMPIELREAVVIELNADQIMDECESRLTDFTRKVMVDHVDSVDFRQRLFDIIDDRVSHHDLISSSDINDKIGSALEEENYATEEYVDDTVEARVDNEIDSRMSEIEEQKQFLSEEGAKAIDTFRPTPEQQVKAVEANLEKANNLLFVMTRKMGSTFLRAQLAETFPQGSVLTQTNIAEARDYYEAILLSMVLRKDTFQPNDTFRPNTANNSDS